jgi:hypothetical protein
VPSADLPGCPRVRLGLGYPWALEGEACGSLPPLGKAEELALLGVNQDGGRLPPLPRVRSLGAGGSGSRPGRFGRARPAPPCLRKGVVDEPIALPADSPKVALRAASTVSLGDWAKANRRSEAENRIEMRFMGSS